MKFDTIHHEFVWLPYKGSQRICVRLAAAVMAVR